MAVHFTDVRLAALFHGCAQGLDPSQYQHVILKHKTCFSIVRHVLSLPKKNPSTTHQLKLMYSRHCLVFIRQLLRQWHHVPLPPDWLRLLLRYILIESCCLRKTFSNSFVSKLSRHSRFQMGICFNYLDGVRSCATLCFSSNLLGLDWEADGRHGVRRESANAEQFMAFTVAGTNQLHINAMCH